jgi:hypothetical protein
MRWWHFAAFPLITYAAPPRSCACSFMLPLAPQPVHPRLLPIYFCR